MEEPISEPQAPTPVRPCVLSPVAARILGCLFEKEFATPDQYPLSLNSLTNACNQRSNREPVMALTEGDVLAGMDELRSLKLAVQVVGAEARVPKYKHKLEQVFEVSTGARAVLCELLVRGPQTAAALRGNALRLTRLPEAAEFEILLEELGRHASGELVRKLPRQPGQKEARWIQLLTGEPAPSTECDAVAPKVVVAGPVAELERRVGELESTVRILAAELGALRAELGIASPASAEGVSNSAVQS